MEQTPHTPFKCWSNVLAIRNQFKTIKMNQHWRGAEGAGNSTSNQGEGKGGIIALPLDTTDHALWHFSDSTSRLCDNNCISTAPSNHDKTSLPLAAPLSGHSYFKVCTLTPVPSCFAEEAYSPASPFWCRPIFTIVAGIFFSFFFTS